MASPPSATIAGWQRSTCCALGRGPNTDVAAVAFDLLELNGEDLRREPIEARKAEADEAIETLRPKLRHPGRAASKSDANAIQSIHLVDHIEADGAVVFEHACGLGCEGIVSKRAGSTISPAGPTNGSRSRFRWRRRCFESARRLERSGGWR